MKRGATHTAETRSRLSEKMRGQMTDADRAKIIADTKARMADPAVRQRIREGMTAANRERDLISLASLRSAWIGARANVRLTFIQKVLAPLFNVPVGS
jgi:hypothetical protein